MGGAVADVRKSAVAAAAKDGEPDRYLAALLAPPEARDGLLALAAFASELARVPFAVSREPAMGAIRLQWWRDALEMPPELKTGSEIADAVRAAVRGRGSDAELLGIMVDGRHASLDPEPFADEAALRTFLWETEGTQFAVASHVLGGGQAGMDLRPAHVAAGAAYGLARLLLDLPRALSQGRVPLAQTQLAAAGLTAQDLRAGTADTQALGRLLDVCRLEIEAHMAEMRAVTRHLQRNTRIAFLPLALVPTYLRAAKRSAASGFRIEPRVTPFTRAGRIALAHWLGRL
jgi:phytoene synthase